MAVPEDPVASEAAEVACAAAASASGARLLCLSLPKLCPAPGVVVWWQAVVKGHGHAVDPTLMPDRDTATQSVFQRNWAQAHAMFKDKVQRGREAEMCDRTQ